jgi:hypothetical protein
MYRCTVWELTKEGRKHRDKVEQYMIANDYIAAGPGRWFSKSFPESHFRIAEATFRNLCERFDMPVPKIVAAFPEDPCDVTDPGVMQVRLKVQDGVEPGFHGAHVFGHWLADLHALDDEMADRVADAIARMALLATEH